MDARGHDAARKKMTVAVPRALQWHCTTARDAQWLMMHAAMDVRWTLQGSWAPCNAIKWTAQTNANLQPRNICLTSSCDALCCFFTGSLVYTTGKTMRRCRTLAKAAIACTPATRRRTRTWHPPCLAQGKAQQLQGGFRTAATALSLLRSPQSMSGRVETSTYTSVSNLVPTLGAPCSASADPNVQFAVAADWLAVTRHKAVFQVTVLDTLDGSALVLLHHRRGPAGGPYAVCRALVPQWPADGSESDAPVPDEFLHWKIHTTLKKRARGLCSFVGDLGRRDEVPARLVRVTASAAVVLRGRRNACGYGA